MRTSVFATVWMVAMVGCGVEEPLPLERSAQSPEVDRLTDRSRRGAIVGGERVNRVVRWPVGEPEAVPLAPRARDAVTSSSLPVLAPATLAADVEVVTGDTWTALSATGEGFTIALQASRQARLHPHVRAAAPTASVRGLDGFVTRNEGIWVASWIENGVAYSLELECAEPFAGKCADDSFVRALAADLVFIGPGGGA